MKTFLSSFWPNPSPPSAGSARQISKPRDVYKCGPETVYDSSKDITRRISFDSPTIVIYGYPSRGGVIMLMDASPADLDFLGLGRIDPPMLRHDDPEAEDTFCQRLLLLGAKWWDSMERGLILSSSEELYVGLDESDEPEPTERERSWISIAWPTGGGLVVSEFDTTMWGVQNTHLDAFVPDDPARLRLCTSMDEKAQVLLNRFRGTVWEGVEHYRGNVFIGCWGTKITGEVGQFQKTWPET